MVNPTTRTLKSIQKNLDSIKRRNDHSTKLRQTHESILTMPTFSENKDVKEFKEQLRSIKKSIENQQNIKKIDPEMKALFEDLNTKVTVIQKWINNYAIGDAVEMATFKDGLRKVDDHVLDNVPLLYHIVEEVRQIKKEERSMQKELLKIEKEIMSNKKKFEKVSNKVALPKKIPKAKKTVKTKKTKKSPKSIASKPLRKQIPIRSKIKNKAIKEEPNKRKDLKKFINVLDNM